MKTTDDSRTLATPGFGVVGHPGETAPVSGAYRCLCCGTVLWRVRKGGRFPECPSRNCPTMWLWYR
jgi:hypothetical protein